MGARDNPMNKQEINRLASLAKNGTSEERNEAWRKLLPVIETVTSRIARRLGIICVKREEFIAEAPSIIFERLAHWDEGRDFLPWARVVLHHWIIDEHRKQQCTRKHETFDEFLEQTPETSRAPDPRPYENLPDLGRPFSDEDLSRLKKDHTATARVIGLTILDVWRNVPIEQWKEWLREAGLPDDFPPQEMDQCEERGERLKRLAELLDVSEQSLRMRLYRFTKKLGDLDWFK